MQEENDDSECACDHESVIGLAVFDIDMSAVVCYTMTSMEAQMKFRELQIGDEFDFISPDRMLNSFYGRCVKASAQRYTVSTFRKHNGALDPLRIGRTDCEVYHVERASVQ